jgi:hypothetical protein
VALCAAGPAVLGAPLSAGDVAIVAVNTDGDAFAWVALRNIPGQTVIHFTDSSVSNGLFRWTEHFGALPPGPLRWSAPEEVRAGTVVRWNGSNAWSLGQAAGAGLDLSADGDQVVAYTGCIASNGACAAPWRGDPTGALVLCAVNLANAGWDNVTGGGTSSSFVPPGVSVAEGTAVHLGSKDDACYAGPRRGRPADLRRWIANATNWITAQDALAPTNWPDAFDVLGQGTLIVFP